ncbi:MAG: repressor LexA [Chloroflexi bacterium]|nr:repressor LexA [Chloroflexota bacterium]
MEELSPRQKRILDFLFEYAKEHEFPPTIREIAEALDISSTSVVKHHLDTLERKGYIERMRDIARGIILKVQRQGEENLPCVRLPISGVIVANSPVPLPDPDFPMFDSDESVTLTRELMPEFVGDPRRLFALKVKGDSMIDALINDGDIVVMLRDAEPRNGDMVAAWIKSSGETTLKRYFREGKDRVRLQPENPTVQPIFVHAGDLEVQGKVVMVVRHLT